MGNRLRDSNTVVAIGERDAGDGAMFSRCSGDVVPVTGGAQLTSVHRGAAGHPISGPSRDQAAARSTI